MKALRAHTLRPGGPVHWGVMLAQGWKGELAGCLPDEAWWVARTWARRVEDLGFDGLWAFDHLQPYPARDASPVLEAWTVLSALSQVTDEVVLGTLVSCAAYRPAGVTAKMAATIGVLGQGRFCLGLGAGWDEPEFRAFDIPFPDVAGRSDRLEATLRSCREWWGETGTGAVRIGPVPDPRPLLLVGGEGPNRTLRSAAVHADLTNWQVGVKAFGELTTVLGRWCEEAGRDPATIRRTHAPNVQLFDTEPEFRRWMQDPARGMSANQVEEYIRSRGAFYGTQEQVAQRAADFVGAGCGGFMMFCNGAPSLEVLEALATLRRPDDSGAA
jgi:alkanesulfonate monooxygenase SsuD/methylene tetrahydromethanopterin reductase-like flavin-dependent oxidoreductase (luciferase family)